MKILKKLQTLVCFGYQLKPVVKTLAIQKQTKSARGGLCIFFKINPLYV
jgi:hypothetical protein